MIYCQSSTLYRKFVKLRPPWEVVCGKKQKPGAGTDMWIPVNEIHQLVEERPPPVEDWAEWCTVRSIPRPELAALLVDQAWQQSFMGRLPPMTKNCFGTNQKVWALEEEYYKFTQKLGIACQEMNNSFEHVPALDE